MVLSTAPIMQNRQAPTPNIPTIIITNIIHMILTIRAESPEADDQRKVHRTEVWIEMQNISKALLMIDKQGFFRGD